MAISASTSGRSMRQASRPDGPVVRSQRGRVPRRAGFAEVADVADLEPRAVQRPQRQRVQFMAAVIAAIPRLHEQALQRLAQALRHLRQQMHGAAQAARIERGGPVRLGGAWLVHPWFQRRREAF
ncbi:hypothetical protein ACFJIX_17570 [Roseateles sp. UC29_93]|uniref:hypothetical protein n=1 Tax=Roseateles sp. UC29_93 TaxID=3350177 RepID=UPI003672DBE6